MRRILARLTSSGAMVKAEFRTIVLNLLTKTRILPVVCDGGANCILSSLNFSVTRTVSLGSRG